MILPEFGPFPKLHDNLSQMENIPTKALEENGNMTSTETAYHPALKDYGSQWRTMGKPGNYELPPAPQLKTLTRAWSVLGHVREIAQSSRRR